MTRSYLGSARGGRPVRSIRIYLLALAVIAASVLGAGPIATAEAAPTASPWVAGDPTFTPPVARPAVVGVNYHPTWLDLDAGERASILDQYAAAGVEWVRVDLGWSNLQPTQPAPGSVGAARFSASALAFLDLRMAEIAQRGMKAQVMFYLPPYWSSGRGTASNPAKDGIPRNFQDYADALAFAAQRWQSVAPVWEIWNEPDIRDFWYTQDPATFSQLLRTAYETAKNASPTTTFVAAPPTYLGLDPKNGTISGQWMRKMYENGARVGKLNPATGRWTGSYDQLGIHPYQSPGDLTPEAPAGHWTMKGIANLVTLMASYGEANVPLNASEFGWTAHPNTGNEKPWERGVTEDQQADYTLRAFGILGGFPQVSAAFVFTDRDFSTSNAWGDRFGLLRADLTKKKGYYALKCVASLICGPAPAPEPPAGPAPAAPSGIEADVSGSRVTLTWTAVPAVTGYRVSRTAPGEPARQVAEVSTTTWSDTDVIPGSTYAYTLTSFNANGQSVASQPVSATVPPGAPATPTGVTVTATSDTATRITWAAVPSATSYTVTRTSVATGTTTQLQSVTGVTTTTDSGLIAGATYRYTVTAANAEGTSAPSAPVSVTLPGGAATGPVTYIAANAPQWRINDSGSNLGTAWRTLTFNDSTWRQGWTEIGYGDGDEASLVEPNKITYYFRKSFDAGSDISRITKLALRTVIDDGAIVYLNGVEVWRYNLPSGTVTSTTRASTYIAGDAEMKWRSATVPVSALRTGNNVIAVEVHNDQPSSSDLSMNLELIGS